MANDKKPCIQRPGYASLIARRKSYQLAKEAALEVNENMITFFSTALDKRSLPILARRMRRLQRLAARSASVKCD